jgi:hypothetical protein
VLARPCGWCDEPFERSEPDWAIPATAVGSLAIARRSHADPIGARARDSRRLRPAAGDLPPHLAASTLVELVDQPLEVNAHRILYHVRLAQFSLALFAL